MYSCTWNHYVLLNKDGSANIEADCPPLFLERLKNSSEISQLDTTARKVKFSVPHIEFIGEYMPYLHPSYFRFATQDNDIVISTANRFPYEYIPEKFYYILPNWRRLKLIIKSEKPMKAYYANGKELKRKQEAIIISYSIERKFKKGNHLNITLKDP